MAGKRDVLLGRSGIGGGSSLSSRGSRIVMAIGVGVIVGCVFALLFPDGFFPPHRERILVGSSSSSQVQSSPCESSEKFNTLKSEFTAISEEKTELEKKVKVLTLALELAKQQQSPAEQPKAGPFGTVKALRKTPTVIPDESVNPRLGKLLQEVAMNKELILVLANSRVTEMLKVWYRNVKRVGIHNYLVVALDDATESLCRSDDVPVYRRDPNEGVDSVGRDGSNHEVSGLKFRILREFLQLGYGVLMSDVDIIYLQNPFDHLYRDSDVESMSDGYDNMTAYGYDDVFDDPKMGWARYAHTMRIWVFNSGFFYLRPTIPSIELLDRVADRLAKSKAWDQAVFNEELFLPSHPGYEGLHASKRVMDRFDFMNSKLLFTQLRHDGRINQIKPVIIHVNYHPNKMDRMNAIEQFYVHGKMDALKSFPDGSE